MQIEIQGATKKYGSLRALDGVSLKIEPGQIVALLGLNGAGKTTLLRALAGIVGLSDGEIRYDGQRFRRDRIDLRRRFMFLPDIPVLFAHFRVTRHIGMVLRLYESNPDGIENRVVDLLKEFDLLPLIDTALGRYSRGQLYKAGLATLLAVDPEVWLLDEPFASGMDPRGIASFRRHVREAVKRGRTVIYSTQLLELAEEFSDRVCVIHRGQAQAFESVQQLRARARVDCGVLEQLFVELTQPAS